jgi:hypothetical protein
MKTPLQLATEHARSIVANRGQWVEPLTWDEVTLLVDAAERRLNSTFGED